MRESIQKQSIKIMKQDTQVVHIIIYQMLQNPPTNLQILVTNLLIDKKYQAAIKNGVDCYQIKQFHIENLTPTDVFMMHYNITSKFYANRPYGNNQSWCENQLRLFIWLLIGYSYLYTISVSAMTSQDWKYFSQIFNHRNPDFLQFQALSILKRETKFAKWTQTQIKLLDSIIKSKTTKNKWNDIAKDLFILSNKQFFRTGKQCRQHWINHLDPNPKRSDWEVYEDYILVKSIRIIGKKWAKVSQKLQGKRTEHMVKNRFKSLFQSQVRRHKQQYHRNFSEQQIMLQLQKKLKGQVQQNNKLRHSYQKQQKQQINRKQNSQQKFRSADEKLAQKQHNQIMKEETNSQINMLDRQNRENRDSRENREIKTIVSSETIPLLDEQRERARDRDAGRNREVLLGMDSEGEESIFYQRNSNRKDQTVSFVFGEFFQEEFVFYQP